MNYYNENAEEFFNGTINLNMEELYKPFLQLIPTEGKILDAGCGSGRDSFNFKKKGYSVTAFDNSEELVRLASNLLGEPILQMSFGDLNFDTEFDGIWACASLLHIPKHDMGKVLSSLALALKPTGVLYASYKYGDKEAYRKERLFSDYTEQAFEALIVTIPHFEVAKCWKTSDVRPNRRDEYWLNILLRKIVR